MCPQQTIPRQIKNTGGFDSGIGVSLGLKGSSLDISGARIKQESLIMRIKGAGRNREALKPAQRALVERQRFHLRSQRATRKRLMPQDQ